MKLKNHKLLTILLASLLGGTLDILSACALNYKLSPLIIFQFIASGLSGASAFKGGIPMVFWGALIHYFIATVFSALLFLLYPKLIKLFRNKYALGVIYGFFIWMVMNLLVLPVTNIRQSSKRFEILNIATGTAALIICIGIPVASIAAWYYKKQPAR